MLFLLVSDGLSMPYMPVCVLHNSGTWESCWTLSQCSSVNVILNQLTSKLSFSIRGN